MFNKIMCLRNPTIENVEIELLNGVFNPDNVKNIFDSKKVNINDKTSNGQTLLHLCLKNNKHKAAQWLIREGIDVNDRGSDNISAARYAVEKGDVNTVKTLTSYVKVDIDEKCKNGRTLLQDAVLLGHTKVIKHLIKYNIDVNSVDNNKRNVIFDAIAHGDNHITEDLVLNNDINLNQIDIKGNTVLHDPKVLKDDNLARLLLENGADPTICNKDGNNFLTYTALRGEAGEAILELAIKCDADLNAKVAYGNSILMEVMHAFAKVSQSEKNRRDGLKSVASKLIKNGLKIDSINQSGESVLFDLIRVNDIEGCAFLLEQGIDPNLNNNKMETPLFIAITKGIKYIDIVILLLQYKADTSVRDKHNRTLMEILNDIILHVHNYEQIEDINILKSIDPHGTYMIVLKELLSMKNFDYSSLDIDGNPLFFKPFLKGDIATTRLYLQNGFDINTTNAYGHNLFYEYVLQAFDKGVYYDDFREHLVFLLVNKSKSSIVNKQGQNIYTKVAYIKNCNLKLFRKLVEISKHDYKSVDSMGRTIIHACVISGNIELLNLVYGVERNIQNIPDAFNILPIVYSALFGNLDMVKEFLRRASIVKSNKPIHKVAKAKFKPLLGNLDTLIEKCKDPNFIKKVEILAEQIKIDFK